jgi:hypothetical protein
MNPLRRFWPFRARHLVLARVILVVLPLIVAACTNGGGGGPGY